MVPLSPSDVRACVHPRLPLRFGLALVCAILLAPLFLVLAFFGVFSLLLFWIVFLVWLFAELMFAYLTDNCILVSALNYPRINTLADEMKVLLGVRKDFSVFVYEHGQFNAAMIRVFRRRAIFLNSEILETGVSDDEVRWLIGRFVGYWRSQQDAGIAGWMIRMAKKFGLLNFFIQPYERAMVYTGDRLGLAGIGGDIGTAVAAMQKLLVGRQLGYSVNPVGVAEQRRLTKGSLFGFLSRISSGYPHMIARYVDLIAFARRRFPDPFGRFEAANPGLPRDLDELSGERTSGGSIAKGFGFLLLWFLAGVATVLVWVFFISMASGVVNRSPLSAIMSNLPRDTMPPGVYGTPNATPDVTPGVITPPTQPNAQAAPAAPPAQPAEQSAAPAAPAAPPNQSAGHVINGAVFAQQPTAADYARVYPDAAKANGVSGSATLRCTVNDDLILVDCQVMDETPPGSGFGRAALDLIDQVKLSPQARDGTPVAGGTLTLRVPFAP